MDIKSILILALAFIAALFAWRVWTDAVHNGRTWSGMAKMTSVALFLVALLLWGRAG